MRLFGFNGSRCVARIAGGASVLLLAAIVFAIVSPRLVASSAFSGGTFGLSGVVRMALCLIALVALGEAAPKPSALDRIEKAAFPAFLCVTGAYVFFEAACLAIRENPSYGALYHGAGTPEHAFEWALSTVSLVLGLYILQARKRRSGRNGEGGFASACGLLTNRALLFLGLAGCIASGLFSSCSPESLNELFALLTVLVVAVSCVLLVKRCGGRPSSILIGALMGEGARYALSPFSEVANPVLVVVLVVGLIVLFLIALITAGLVAVCSAFDHDGRNAQQNQKCADARKADPDKGVDGLGRMRAALSSREREILDMTARGMSQREIAEELHLAVSTVGTYRARAYKRMGFKNGKDFSCYMRSQDMKEAQAAAFGSGCLEGGESSCGPAVASAAICIGAAATLLGLPSIRTVLLLMGLTLLALSQFPLGWAKACRPGFFAKIPRRVSLPASRLMIVGACLLILACGTPRGSAYAPWLAALLLAASAVACACALGGALGARGANGPDVEMSVDRARYLLLAKGVGEQGVEVALRTLEGMDAGEIAASLHMSKASVVSSRMRTYRRLAVHGKEGLRRYIARELT